MKPLLLGLVLSWINFTLIAQCPSAPLVLGSQADIDNFSINYPNCTQLGSTLLIDEIDGPIDNLMGLSNLVSISALNIQYTHIEDFWGLENLTQLDELRLFRNNELQNFDGFESLEHVTSFNALENASLLTTQGLVQLNSVEYLNLYGNENLSDLIGFAEISTLTSLRLVDNNLTSLSDLTNLIGIEDELYISDEPLADLNSLLPALDNYSGTLYLINNSSLVDVSVFFGITNLEQLVIAGNSELSDFNGFQNLVSVSNLFRLGFNPQMTDLTAFSALNSVGSLDIYENHNLLSLSGLESLTQITQAVYLMDNPNLEDIQALENVAAQGLQQVVISRNTSLTTCDNNFVCQVIFDPEINEEIQANANGCNSVPQVAARCILGSIEQGANVSVELWPNPVATVLHLKSSNTEIETLRVYNAQGRLIDFIPSFAPQIRELDLDVSAYAVGLYFITLETNLGMSQLKFIKR